MMNSTSRKQSQQSQSRSKSRSLSNSQVENKFYFCHYKNAMYMGGMKSFHRNGEGIIIHDNGTSVVCSHYNDFKHGHNIAYLDNCIMSMFYDKNKLTQCVFRVPSFLLFVKYNKQNQIDGKGVLINYEKRTITYLFYKKNVLANRKQEKEYAIINRVFDLQNLQFLIGLSHSKAIKYEVQQSQNIGVIKTGSKASIGFCKRGLLNGLGFTLNIKDPNHLSEAGRNSLLYLKTVQRGYFQNSQLSGMGQKWFKNGNYYIGDFKDNIFQGRGILKNSEKNTWVLGCFCKGNMAELIQYSNQGDVQKFKKLVQVMHERKSSWISKQISLQNPQNFFKQIEKIINNRPLDNKKTLQQKKQQVLRKIQDNFICEDGQSQSSIFGPNSALFAKGNMKEVPFPQVTNTANNANNENSINQQNQFYHSPYRSTQKKSQKRADQNKTNQEGRSVYNIKLLQVPNTSSKETPTKFRRTSASPNQYQPIDTSKLKASQKSMGFSQIKEQSPSFKLDSKRMIGRSRLFKYSVNDEEEELPKFNFTPHK